MKESKTIVVRLELGRQARKILGEVNAAVFMIRELGIELEELRIKKAAEVKQFRIEQESKMGALVLDYLQRLLASERIAERNGPPAPANDGGTGADTGTSAA